MREDKKSMSSKDFHNEPFDDETKLKLEIFRDYIREWLPVFFSKGCPFQSINIFDFFAGPGRDSIGQEGSPLIIIDEINKYTTNPEIYINLNIPISILFNDFDSKKIESLKKEIDLKNIGNLKIKCTDMDFQESFEANQRILGSNSDASLVILDQSGVKQIPPAIFQQLIDLPTTDFMFFISSSFLKRFIETPAMKQYFPNMSAEKIRAVSLTNVHRFVCEHYSKLIPSQKDYYLAPYSIKKGANIHGIIFGSSKLIGLEKFLKVSWDKDGISGEANFDIDDDFARNGPALFEDMNISKKINVFSQKIINFLTGTFKSNNDLYKFTLEYGCLPKHTKKILRTLQNQGRIQTDPPDIRKGSFYLNWDYYKKQEVKAKFRMKE